MKMKFFALLVMCFALSLLAACGTGGGTSVDAGAPAVNQAAAVSAPTALTVSQVTDTTAVLTWTAASGGSGGVFSYTVYRDGVAIGHTSATTTAPAPTTFTDSGLTAGVTYVYTVSASDVLGNESTKSTSIPATTASTPTTATNGGYTLQAGETVPTSLSASMINGKTFYWSNNLGIYGQISFPVDGSGNPVDGVFAEIAPVTISSQDGWVATQFTPTAMPIIVTEKNNGTVLSVSTFNIVAVAPDYYVVSDVVANTDGSVHYLRFYFGANAESNARAFAGR